MKNNPIRLNSQFPSSSSLSISSQHFKIFHNPKLTLPSKLPSLFTNSHLLLAGGLALPALQVSRSNPTSFDAMDNNNNNNNDELVIEACTTRYLPPALTLMHGLQALMDALLHFKLHPPSPPSPSGLIRFQVAVPPSVKALEWFSCQPESSGVFPQFYMSKQLQNQTEFSSKTYGVFGLGAAVQSPSNFDKWNSFRRYLLVDVPNITSYGFSDFNYDIESSSFKHETGSCCFIIPQVELNECEGFCILSGTLVWNDSHLCNFEEALHSYEASLLHAINHVPATLNTCFTNFMKSIQKFNIVEDKNFELFYMEAQGLGRYNNVASVVEMKNVSSSSQFCIRLSKETAVSKYMLDDTSVTKSILQNCANINSVWASLIVEECSRLGLTYFCIAPGSRSSPLAVAASTHPRITCVACYDERSLAFHAVGYARGSRIPAVVVTTSGTAVSNLFPAVVEASQDFVPLVLLTADRPAELHAAGANQAIDQVNHFGSYVRFFFNLPAPTDNIPARMVLTTVDTAIDWAISSPCGPVHINCPFREPLENSPRNWMKSCLDKLDHWIASTQPFTNYIKVHPSYAHNVSNVLTADIEKVITNCKRGLLVVGSLHKEEDMWAALVLAQHLSWPIVVDILSGLRLRKLLTSYREYEDQFVFIDHFDHVLLCDAARQWSEVDVIIQLGSRITSARVSRFLEQCFPCSFIMVDSHPFRHDFLHIVTHRIQCTISQFAGCLINGTLRCENKKWNRFLQIMDSAVAWELSFQICSEYSLTEPHVSLTLSDVIGSESALFIGNSMVIRDADMYSRGVVDCTAKTSQYALPCQWIHIAGNRGASGIDGLLSTAVGFAAGCKKRVFCIIGDVSFLHDTNGLAILSSRRKRKPITVLLMNNHGGGIFSFLPIAEKTEAEILEKYFYYNHNISFSKLCAAHGVKHLVVETKLELHQALLNSQHADEDCVIEVSGSISSNAAFHSLLRKHAAQAVFHAFTTLSQLCPPHAAEDDFFFKISKLDYSLYQVGLAAPPTSVSVVSNMPNFGRQGFILALTLDDGSTGFGEIAPLEIHRENLHDVEEQLRFLLHSLKGASISYQLPLLRGAFSAWMWRIIGVPPDSIYPSVRCGLEMAALNAIAARQKCTLLGVLSPQPPQGNVISHEGASIDICALVDSEGGPMEVANIVFALVEEGFRAVKVKVARRDDPKEDSAVIKEIRRKVGTKVELRVDANRKWTYKKAVEFGSLVKDCGLEYIEEPVQCEDDIVRFCQETGLPVALDETIDKIQDNIPDSLARFTHPGVVALVIKPSVVGGFENAAAIAWWAYSKGKVAVVSATFETSLGLSSYVQFACYLEMRSAELSRALDKSPPKSVAHGLGTYKWLVEDSTLNSLAICRQPKSTYMGASIANADLVLQKFQVNSNAILRKYVEEHISTYQLVVEVEDLSYVVNVQEIGENKNNNALLFLHGFLGTSEDWTPIMKALSASARCFSVDLPGHGKSRIQSLDRVDSTGGKRLSIEVVAMVLSKVISKLCTRKVTLVGYSMGARIALYTTLKLSGKIDGAVLISGSPGLKDETERRVRAAKDDSRARSLISFGLLPFLDNWYRGDLWKSFRDHPSFRKIVASRSEHDDIHDLAQALSDLSIGRQPSLWEDLKHCETPLLFIVGENDVKFKKISEHIWCELGPTTKHETVEVPNSGHAVHLENPLAIVRLVRQFLARTS